MRKISVLLCLAGVLGLVCLAGCGSRGGEGATPSASAAAPEASAEETAAVTDPMGLRMEVSNVTYTGLDVAFVQEGAGPTGNLMTGRYYTLDRMVDDQWESVPYATGEDRVAWTMEGIGINKGGRTELGTLDWSWLYGQLPDGLYRLGKSVSDHRGPGDYDEYHYYALFRLPDETPALSD